MAKLFKKLHYRKLADKLFLLFVQSNFKEINNSILKEEKSGTVNELISLLEDKVIALNSAPKIFTLAENVNGVNIPRLEDEIVKLKDVDTIIRFASNIFRANKQKLAEIVLSSGNIGAIYRFAVCAGIKDVTKFQTAIMNSRDLDYIADFARFVKFADIEQMTDYVCKTGDAKFMCEFAHKVEGCNLKKLLNEIIKTNDAEYICKFTPNPYNWYKYGRDSVYFSKTDIALVENALVKIGNAKWLVEFAENVDNIFDVDYYKIKDAIITSGDLEYITKFALRLRIYDCYGNHRHDAQDREKIIVEIANYICKSRNAEAILWFFKNICKFNYSYKPIISHKDFEDAMFATSNNEYIVKFILEEIDIHVNQNNGKAEHIYNVQSMEKHTDFICRYGTGKDICKYAQNVLWANSVRVDKLTDALCKTDDAESIYKYSKEVNNIGKYETENYDKNIRLIRVDELQQAIIRIDDKEFIAKFASVKGANKELLRHAFGEVDQVICSKEPKLIYYYARYLAKVEDIIKLEDAILATEDWHRIKDFAKDVKGANTMRLEEYLKDEDEDKWLFWFHPEIWNKYHGGLGDTDD